MADIDPVAKMFRDAARGPRKPQMSEKAFMAQVTHLAALKGWKWAHFPRAQTTTGWRTPVAGLLGKGWPDLVLVRDGELFFIELKRDSGRTTPEQDAVLATLGTVGRTAVWRPKDWPVIEMLLTHGAQFTA